MEHRTAEIAQAFDAPADFFPSAGGLRRAEAAAYEYLGLAWAKVRGRI